MDLKALLLEAKQKVPPVLQVLHCGDETMLDIGGERLREGGTSAAVLALGRAASCPGKGALRQGRARAAAGCLSRALWQWLHFWGCYSPKSCGSSPIPGSALPLPELTHPSSCHRGEGLCLLRGAGPSHHRLPQAGSHADQASQQHRPQRLPGPQLHGLLGLPAGHQPLPRCCEGVGEGEGGCSLGKCQSHQEGHVSARRLVPVSRAATPRPAPGPWGMLPIPCCSRAGLQFWCWEEVLCHAATASYISPTVDMLGLSKWEPLGQMHSTGPGGFGWGELEGSRDSLLAQAASARPGTEILPGCPWPCQDCSPV